MLQKLDPLCLTQLFRDHQIDEQAVRGVRSPSLEPPQRLDKIFRKQTLTRQHVPLLLHIFCFPWTDDLLRRPHIGPGH